MIQAFTHRVDRDTVKSVLNTVYAVFLGMLFTFFLSLDNGDNAPTAGSTNQSASHSSGGPTSGVASSIRLKLHLTPTNAIPVVLISLYFLFDWFSFNMTIMHRKGVNHLLVICLTLAITYLGGLVILAFVPNLVFFMAFGIYALAVPWWDLWLKGMMRIRRSYLIWALLLPRVSIAGLFLSVVSLSAFARPSDTCDRLHGFCMTCLGLYVGLKILRYFILVQNTRQESPAT